MNSYLEKYMPILTRVLLICSIVLGIYFVSTTLVFYILPFILGWCIASILEPIIHVLVSHLKLSRNLATFVVVSFFVLLIGSIAALIGGIILVQLTKLSIELPQYSKKLYFYSSNIAKKMENLYIQFPSDIDQSITNGMYALLEYFTSMIAKFIASLLSFISAVPRFFVFLLVTILSTFFIARDKKEIKEFIIAQLPTHARPKSRILKQDLLFALMGYIKAQLILMSITFIESAIGLTIIGIDYSILLAFFASVIDALPILGTGSVYIPLILWNVFTNNFPTAASLGILYTIIILIRQLLEPKILGNQIGLYPLVTLISMYIGLKLFGILGLIIGPISVIIFITLQKIDLLPKWKK